MTAKLKVSEQRVRQVLSGLLALLLIGSVGYVGVKYYGASHAATANTIYLNPQSATWTSGSNVSVTVREDSSTTAINAVQFTLNYNSTALQFTGYSESGAFDFVAPQAPTCTPTSTSCATSAGLIRMMRGRSSSTVTGVQDVVTLNFKVVGSSGTAAMTFDQSTSLISRTDGTNILTGVGNGSYTLQAPIVTDAAFTLTPSATTVDPGSSVAVTLHLASPTQGVFSTHSVITYPSNLVQYVSVSTPAGSPLPSDAQTTNTAGALDLVRSVNFGGGGFKGSDGSVVVANFKVIGTSGTIPFDVKRVSGGQDSGAFDTNGTNILGKVNATSVTIKVPVVTPPASGGGGTPPSTTPPSTTPPGVTPTNSPKTPVNNGSTKFTPTNSGNVTISGDTAQLQGSVDLAPLVDPTVLAQNPGDSIKKVEYYLGTKLIATKDTSPYTYTFDSKKLRNGTYDMTVKTYYSSGIVSDQKQKLVVKNPVTIGYIMAHYATGIGGSILGLLIIVFLLWKYVWPRFGNRIPTSNYDYGYAVTTDSSNTAAGYDPYQAPAASVVAPTVPGASGVIAPAQSGATDVTEPLGMHNPQTISQTAPGGGVTPAQVVSPTPPAAPAQQPPQNQNPPTQPPAAPQQ
jgi:hypothetical protein